MRIGLVALGIGLGILFLVGLSQHAAAWLVWIDCALAVISLAMALMPVERLATRRDVGTTDTTSLVKASPVGIGVALLALWIIALAVGAQAWMAWWTFAFGLAYLLFGAGMVTTQPSGTFERAFGRTSNRPRPVA